jgi:hypothetical protein
MDIPVNAYKKTKLVDHLRDKIGKHFSIRMGQNYVSWIRLLCFLQQKVFFLAIRI